MRSLSSLSSLRAPSQVNLSLTLLYHLISLFRTIRYARTGPPGRFLGNQLRACVLQNRALHIVHPFPSLEHSTAKTLNPIARRVLTLPNPSNLPFPTVKLTIYGLMDSSISQDRATAQQRKRTADSHADGIDKRIQHNGNAYTPVAPHRALGFDPSRGPPPVNEQYVSEHARLDVSPHNSTHILNDRVY